MQRLRSAPAIAVVVIGVLAVIGLLGIGVIGGAYLTRDCSFSRDTWAAGRDPVNFEVLERDLLIVIYCGSLDGASSAEVEQLLGTPDTRSAAVWTYDVGVPELLSDYPDLELRFGESGRIEDAKVPGYID
jgi:hypothetical protein